MPYSKEERKEYDKKWYQLNKEKKAEYNRKWNEENKEKKSECDRRYREENKEKIREQNIKWREENKEKRSEYNKKWREENKEKRKEKAAEYYQLNKKKIVEYAKAHRDKRRAYCREYLGGKCVKCGTTHNLQFDHIKREGKKYTIASRVTQDFTILKEELDKCQLLCAPCHLEKTAKEWVDMYN